MLPLVLTTTAMTPPSSYKHTLTRIWSSLLFLTTCGVFCYLFGIQFVIKDFRSIFSTSINSKIMFTQKQFRLFVHESLFYAIVLGFFGLVFVCLCNLYYTISSRKVLKIIKCMAMTVVALFLFFASIVPLVASVDKDNAVNNGYPWTLANGAYHLVQPYAVVNSYGLFRRMTGVGGRPEVIVQGSRDGKTWVEYNFTYKPGNLEDRPTFCAPHQPRLDWQMWFAALGTPDHNLWLIHLAIRLMEGEKSVLNLLGNNSKFQNRPPKYIRMIKYLYHFNTEHNSSRWWSRKEAGIYLSPISLDNVQIKKFIQQRGYNSISKYIPSINQFGNVIHWVRSAVDSMSGSSYTGTLLLTIFLLVSLRPGGLLQI